MASSDSTWRTHPFKVGATYQALESFEGFPNSSFEVGKNYTLQGVGYSHYDSSTVFTFSGEKNGSEQWWWHDDQSDELPSKRFRVVT